MTCVLQQDESHTTCEPGTITTTLYLSYRESGPNAQHAFDFISGKVCHAGDNLAEDDTSSSQMQASLERCKRLCAEDSACKAVSVKNGRCIMSSSFAFRSGCGNVHLKLRRNRFGTILTVKKGVISPPTTVISDRNPAECRAICQARRDCVNVLTDCSTTTPNSCELTGVRDTSNDTDAENAVADCTPDRADVHVYESRHIFTSIRSRICRSLLSITGEFAVDSRNECAEACIALASDCTGFAFGTALVTSSFNNCVTYKSSAKLSDLHSPRCEVSGNFFPVLRDAGTLSASELKARLWMRSPNGRVARDMMRSALELQRVVDEKGQVFEAASITSGALLLPLDTVTALVAPAQEQAIASGVALQGLGKSLAGMSGALSAIPVIGKVVQTFVKKTARRTLEPAGEKLRNNGIRIGKLEKNLEKTGSKVSMIDGLFLASAGVLVSVASFFYSAGDILVKAHMCAFELGEEQVVAELEATMEAMRNGSQVLIRHLNNIPSNVTNPFGDLKLRLDILSVKLPNLLSEFTKINLALQPFMWLTKFMEFRMCFYFLFFEKCFTVGHMLNILGKLFGVLSFLVNPIADLFAGLFPDISLPLPSLLDSWLLDLDKIMLDIDIAYNTLLPAMQFPFDFTDLMLPDILAKLPDNLPCNPFDDDAEIEAEESLEDDDGESRSHESKNLNKGHSLAISPMLPPNVWLAQLKPRNVIRSQNPGCVAERVFKRKSRLNRRVQEQRAEKRVGKPSSAKVEFHQNFQSKLDFGGNQPDSWSTFVVVANPFKSVHESECSLEPAYCQFQYVEITYIRNKYVRNRKEDRERGRVPELELAPVSCWFELKKIKSTPRISVRLADGRRFKTDPRRSKTDLNFFHQFLGRVRSKAGFKKEKSELVSRSTRGSCASCPVGSSCVKRRRTRARLLEGDENGRVATSEFEQEGHEGVAPTPVSTSTPAGLVLNERTGSGIMVTDVFPPDSFRDLYIRKDTYGLCVLRKVYASFLQRVKGYNSQEQLTTDEEPMLARVLQLLCEDSKWMKDRIRSLQDFRSAQRASGDMNIFKAFLNGLPGSSINRMFPGNVEGDENAWGAYSQNIPKCEDVFLQETNAEMRLDTETETDTPAKVGTQWCTGTLDLQSNCRAIYCLHYGNQQEMASQTVPPGKYWTRLGARGKSMVDVGFSIDTKNTEYINPPIRGQREVVRKTQFYAPDHVIDDAAGGPSSFSNFVMVWGYFNTLIGNLADIFDQKLAVKRIVYGSKFVELVQKTNRACNDFLGRGSLTLRMDHQHSRHKTAVRLSEGEFKWLYDEKGLDELFFSAEVDEVCEPP